MFNRRAGDSDVEDGAVVIVFLLDYFPETVGGCDYVAPVVGNAQGERDHLALDRLCNAGKQVVQP